MPRSDCFGKSSPCFKLRGGVYSCPDFFRLPNSDAYVFGVLGGDLWLGNYSLGEDGNPTFVEVGSNDVHEELTPTAGRGGDGGASAVSNNPPWSTNCSNPNGAPCFGFDRPGDDLHEFFPYNGTWQHCSQLCDEEPKCMVSIRLLTHGLHLCEHSFCSVTCRGRVWSIIPW